MHSKASLKKHTPSPNQSGQTLERGPRLVPSGGASLPGKSKDSKQTKASPHNCLA